MLTKENILPPKTLIMKRTVQLKTGSSIDKKFGQCFFLAVLKNDACQIFGFYTNL